MFNHLVPNETYFHENNRLVICF